MDHAGLASVRSKAGVPRDAASCHTAFVGRFVVEGHVPASTLRRLVEEDPPDVVGLVVPGMPHGSPGMESSSPQAYTVLAIGTDGSLRPFEEIP